MNLGESARGAVVLLGQCQACWRGGTALGMPRSPVQSLPGAAVQRGSQACPAPRRQWWGNGMHPAGPEEALAARLAAKRERGGRRAGSKHTVLCALRWLPALMRVGPPPPLAGGRAHQGVSEQQAVRL